MHDAARQPHVFDAGQSFERARQPVEQRRLRDPLMFEMDLQ